jgi:hypothetical protein
MDPALMTEDASRRTVDETARINLVRIGLGLVLLHRYGCNAHALLILPSTGEQIFTIGFELAAAFLLMVGLLTPIAALSLFLFQWDADHTLLSWSLSSMVVQMLLLVLTLLPAGTRLSVDAWLRRRSGVLRGLYAIWGPPTPERASTLRFMAFVSYAVVSLSAVQFHLSNPLWRSGLAQLCIFTNPYWSPSAAVFRGATEKWPEATLLASRLVTAAMLLWEALMLPLALSGRKGRAIVAGYGTIFFVTSAVLLQLGWLPYFEILLWALVFLAGPPLLFPRALPAEVRLRVGAAIYAVGVAGALIALPWIGGANRVRVISEHLGIGPTDVFNALDLRTNESYATIARIRPNGAETLLPFNAPDGKRLAWHDSERVYYGISLPWRRARIAHSDCDCWNETIDRRPVDELIEFDRRTGAPDDSRYALTFYAEHLPDAAQVQHGQFRLKATVRCRVLYDPAHAAILSP